MRIHEVTRAPINEQAEQLLGPGYITGPPAQVPAEVIEVDRHIWQRSACPACRRRVRTFHPFHSVLGRYRCVVVCQACGHAEEV
jgi:hypothetical protein